MTLNKAKNTLVRHAGILIGGALGLLSGLHVFGLAIGTLVGYFVDEFLNGRRIIDHGTRLMSRGDPGFLEELWLKRVLCISLACIVASKKKDNAEFGVAGKQLLKTRITAGLAVDGRESGLVEQLIDKWFDVSHRRQSAGPETSTEQPTIRSADSSHQGTSRNAVDPRDPLQIAAFFKAYSIDVEHENLIRLLFSVCTGAMGRISRIQGNLIKNISEALELPASIFNTIRIELVAVDNNAYDILGIQTDASDAEIKAVYRRLAAQFHPDTGSALEEHQQEESQEAFMRIKSAFNRIMEERQGMRNE